MATKLQRKILWQFINNGKRGVFITGHKSTTFQDTIRKEHGGGCLICCSEVVLGGLTANKWVSKLTPHHTSKLDDRVYTITEAGITAAGRQEPEMRPSYTGGRHGPRWV